MAIASSGSKRFGIDVRDDLDLELRLCNIEQELLNKADSNIETTIVGQEGAIPVKITGLTVDSTQIGQFTISWTETEIPSLRRYEIQVDTNNSFSNPTTFTQLKTIFIYSRATTNITYYVRVRAINTNEQPSLWSDTVNTSTGLISTNLMEVNSASQMVTRTILGGFDWLIDDDGYTWPIGTPPTGESSVIYDGVTITTQANGIVLPYIFMAGEFQSIFGVTTQYSPGYGYILDYVPDLENDLTINLLRRRSGTITYTTIASDVVDFKSTVPISTSRVQNYKYTPITPPAGNTARFQINVPQLPDIPGAGTWEYRIQLIVNSNQEGIEDPLSNRIAASYLAILPSELEMRFFEYKV